MQDAELAFCRFTQIGLLRLLTTTTVMGRDCHTIKQAWTVYDLWAGDPTVCYIEDPLDVTVQFRRITTSSGHGVAPKAIGDCYLLALSVAARATLVTFDSALFRLARRLGHAALLLE